MTKLLMKEMKRLQRLPSGQGVPLFGYPITPQTEIALYGQKLPRLGLFCRPKVKLPQSIWFMVRKYRNRVMTFIQSGYQPETGRPVLPGRIGGTSCSRQHRQRQSCLGGIQPAQRTISGYKGRLDLNRSFWLLPVFRNYMS